MKRHLSLIFASMCAWTMLNAQNIVPNGSFENWVTKNYELPTNYPVSSVNESFLRGIISNVEKTTDAYQGQYAVKLTTLKSASDTIGAWFANSSDAEGGNPSSWRGGIAYNQIPTGIKGYYKYNVEKKDSALVGIVLKRNGVSYAHYYYALGGIHTTYTPFEFAFSPEPTQAPDTIIFVATSSNLLVFDGIPESSATFDNVSLTGVTSQPELLNGDFETWTNYTTSPRPAAWNSSDTDNEGLLRTTDAYVGNYALELRTYEGRNDNNQPEAQNGWIQFGQYMNGNNFLGGFPFNQAHDKLIFNYKYAPHNPNDKANIYIMVKRNGSWVGGNGMQLTASAIYQYAELNINTNDGLAPDSAYISINSSDWNNKDLSYVGASLKIDGLAFKSHLQNNQDIFIANDAIKFYPNPFKVSSTLVIQPEIDITGAELHIYSLVGTSVKVQPITSYKTTFYKNNLLPGTYYWEVSKGNTILKTGKFIIE